MENTTLSLASNTTTLSPDLGLHNLNESDIFLTTINSTAREILGNGTTGNHHNRTILEGGFLTGRNPFVFMPAMPMPTFIIQLLVIVCMSRLVKLVLSPFKQPCKLPSFLNKMHN